MNYEKTVPFQGDFNKAAEVVKNTLLPHGFQIINTYDNSIELEGTRSVMNKGADPLIGILWIHIQKTNSSLIIKAEFGGISKSAKFMTYIIIAGLLFNFVFLGIFFSKHNASMHKMIPLFATFIIVPIVIPFSFKFMKIRTAKSIDTLLSNMIALGN
ncbi:MAG: hypothetical protein JXA96_17620 [Sedimentisphaerales bacterium]|nr:hypothetical protein [Sedimentisphaerales bacterium]